MGQAGFEGAHPAPCASRRAAFAFAVDGLGRALRARAAPAAARAASVAYFNLTRRCPARPRAVCPAPRRVRRRCAQGCAW